MKKITAFNLLTALFIFLSNSAFAWGLTGHRVVAEIADQRLTKRAKRNIQQILGNESLAMAANWPDFIKSDPSYAYLNSWHYVNFNSGLTFEQLKSQLHQDTTANAYSKLMMLFDQLKNRQSLDKATQIMYLRLVIHLVGDIHQPMHTGRFEDLGGNKIKLYWFNTPTNLHRIWDEQLIDFQQLSFTEYTKAINFTTPKQQAEWQGTPLEKWMYESYQISESLYGGVQPEEKLSYRYNFDHINTLNQQLLKGGIRLAKILNNLFG
ncbi:S1/P1 nuclease [Olivibacter sp. XZL3]|uniref:S1/P1 nuclease n=1 Tax=Olivibacter sp. XZL3 TaxID=1735116 RepID=UPI00106547BC|nr:S1/P1 nuclease [Olivibacter sp. XZL3]